MSAGEHWNARKTHCPRNHPYDEENTVIRPNGQRGCRACSRETHQKLAAARKLARAIARAEQDARPLSLPWADQALCAQTDPEAFFPEKGGSTREAKQVCGNCEVRAECLDYALEHGEKFGIWGGLSERERYRLTRQAA